MMRGTEMVPCEKQLTAQYIGTEEAAGGFVDTLIATSDFLVSQDRAEIGIDWHGHRDRGLGLINAIIAIEAGADRIHGTALGIGERVGNAALDQTLMNLKLLGALAEQPALDRPSEDRVPVEPATIVAQLDDDVPTLVHGLQVDGAVGGLAGGDPLLRGLDAVVDGVLGMASGGGVPDLTV